MIFYQKTTLNGSFCAKLSTYQITRRKKNNFCTQYPVFNGTNDEKIKFVSLFKCRIVNRNNPEVPDVI